MGDEQDEFENYYAYPAGGWPADPAAAGDGARRDDRDATSVPDVAQPPTTDTGRWAGWLTTLLRRLLGRT